MRLNETSEKEKNSGIPLTDANKAYNAILVGMVIIPTNIAYYGAPLIKKYTFVGFHPAHTLTLNASCFYIFIQMQQP